MKDETGSTVHEYIIRLCNDCVDGIGEMCNNPDCTLCRHAVDIPIGRELLVPYSPPCGAPTVEEIETLLKDAGSSWCVDPETAAPLIHALCLSKAGYSEEEMEAAWDEMEIARLGNFLECLKQRRET